MTAFLAMLGLTILQNASYTLVSRARNSSSLGYHTVSAVASNILYIIVLRNIILNLNTASVITAYLIGSVIGSVSMHWASMKWIERGKRKVTTS